LTTDVSPQIRSHQGAAALDQLYGAYAAAVDSHDWHKWPEFFTSDCSYMVFSQENVDHGLPLAYMLDDNRDRLFDRVKFVTDVWAGTIEPYRTRHFIQRTLTTDRGDGTFQVRANLIVTYTEADGVPGILASGYYEDLVRTTDQGLLFVEKNVFLDGTPSRYLVYPL